MDNTVLTEKSNEEEIISCFKAAIETLDRVDANAEKEKTQIVKDLAKDLEGKIPTDSICNEIVHQLHDKGVSPRTIRNCLDAKYKEKHRAENARKQKRKESTEDLAASVPLEQEKPKQQIAVTQDGNSVIMNDTSTNTEASPISSDGANEPHRQNAIGTNANNEERTTDTDTKEEPVVTHSLNDEITSTIKQTEDLTDTKKGVLVSHISMPFENLRRDMSAVFQSTKGIGNVFFKVCIDLGTRVVEIDFCGITQHEPMISTGKGILKEAGTIFPLGS